jgi:hypothetical protein
LSGLLVRSHALASSDSVLFDIIWIARKYGVAIVRGVAKGPKIIINLPKDTEIIQHPAHTWQRPQSLRPVEDQGYGVDFIVDR